MRKLLSGIIAAVVALGGWSESEAGEDAGGSVKLWVGGPGHSENWVLYEDLPEDAGLLSINSVADEDQPLLICQSEDGVVGTVSESHSGAVCDTRDGEEDTFYVLIMGPPVDENYEDVDEDYEDEEESGGIADALRKKQSKRMRESHGGGGMLPDFDWTEEEKEEMAEALEATDAWQRFVEEGDGGRRGVIQLSGWLK